MTVDPRVWNFPTFPISKQLFYVPGAASDGSFTSGGARIISPEPGGFSRLEIQPSLQLGEWQFPLSSWLMSKTNGELIRVRLVGTPQVASLAALAAVPWGEGDIYPDSPWDGMIDWAGELMATYSADALEGSTALVIDMTEIGPILRPGHVIGAGFSTYLIDDVYYSGNVAHLQVIPPLRKNVATGDSVYFKPWFTGTIANGSDFRTTYDADHVGMIQVGKIVLNEAYI